MRPVHTHGGIEYTAPDTAGAVYSMLVDIIADDQIDEPMRIACLAEWCASYTDHTAKEIVETVGVEIYDLAYAMVRSAGLSQEARADLRTLLDIGTGADDFDESRESPPCACPKCAGALDDFDGCKYASVTPRAYLLAEWTFLASHPELWDRPLSLLHVAMELESSRGRGQSAIYQRSDREREEKKRAESVRGKYGHKW